MVWWKVILLLLLFLIIIGGVIVGIYFLTRKKKEPSGPTGATGPSGPTGATGSTGTIGYEFVVVSSLSPTTLQIENKTDYDIDIEIQGSTEIKKIANKLTDSINFNISLPFSYNLKIKNNNFPLNWSGSSTTIGYSDGSIIVSSTASITLVDGPSGIIASVLNSSPVPIQIITTRIIDIPVNESIDISGANIGPGTYLVFKVGSIISSIQWMGNLLSLYLLNSLATPINP